MVEDNLLLELLNVEKTFKDQSGRIFTALKDIHLKVYSGEFISVMGPSGSGKTTLSNMIGLLSLPTSGEIRFLGNNISNLVDAELTDLRRKYIGFVFQDYMLVDHMDIVQNAMLSMHLHESPEKEIRQKAIELLVMVGLENHLLKTPKQLSGGQKQRVAIVRALLKNPSLILADEPAGALDSKSRVEVLDLLQQLNEAGTTIVMVTHNAEDARAGTRLIHIANSQISGDSRIDDRLLFKTVAA